MTEKALEVIDVDGSALEYYGSREIVRELQLRLMKFHPAAKEVGENGMVAAAQLAVLMGASPLPGLNEIHIWYDSKKKQPMIQPGINYWRRKADEKGGVVWDARNAPRPMTEDERVAYAIPDNQHGAICRGVRLNDIRGLKELGFTIQDVFNARIITGVGTCGKTEYPKSGRPILWSAMKRAETDFYKQAFPYTPGETLRGGSGMTQELDGTYRPDYGPQWGQLDSSLREDESVIDGDVISTDEVIDSLFDDEPQTIDTTDEDGTDDNPPETLREFAVWFADKHSYYDNNYHVVGALKKLFGESIGNDFKNRAISEYIENLEQYAKENTDTIQVEEKPTIAEEDEVPF